MPNISGFLLFFIKWNFHPGAILFLRLKNNESNSRGVPRKNSEINTVMG
jgi:hypothetical protein